MLKIQIVLEAMKWMDAAQKCHRHGATLAVFRSKEENDFVGSEFNDNFFITKINKNF